MMDLPGRPPGLVPVMDAGEGRLRVFDRHLSDGAIGAAVDLLDEERAHCNVAEVGIEFDRGVHFEISLFLGIDLAQREQGEVQTIEFVQGAHQSGLVSNVPGKDHFTFIQ